VHYSKTKFSLHIHRYLQISSTSSHFYRIYITIVPSTSYLPRFGKAGTIAIWERETAFIFWTRTALVWKHGHGIGIGTGTGTVYGKRHGTHQGYHLITAHRWLRIEKKLDFGFSGLIGYVPTLVRRRTRHSVLKL
jgi:hypothetical protein